MIKKIVSLIVMSGMGLAVGGQVYAASLGTSLMGSANVGNGSVGVQASTSASMQAQGMSDASGSMNGMGNMGMTGTASGTGSMNMINGNLGLQAQLQTMSGTMATSSEDSIVNLQGDTEAAIQSDADLAAYNNLVIQTRPAITAINTDSNNGVDITYAQPARFLGIFPTTISGQVNVDAQGNTTVSLPWWSFLYSKDTSGVQSAVTTAAQTSNADLAVGASSMTSLQDSASMINAVTAAIQSEFQASGSANVSGN